MQISLFPVVLSLVLFFFDRGRVLFPYLSNKLDLIAMRMLHETGRARALVDFKRTSTLQDLRVAEPAARKASMKILRILEQIFKPLAFASPRSYGMVRTMPPCSDWLMAQLPHVEL